MTYKELLEALSLLSENQLNNHVTILDLEQDEYFGASCVDLELSDATSDVTDEGHPIIKLRR